MPDHKEDQISNFDRKERARYNMLTDRMEFERSPIL